MSTRFSTWFRKLPAPRSLRKQLLAISLLILSGLLLLIGVLQYILMRDFIYSNRAESMEAQIRSVPREMFFNFFNSYDEDTTTPNEGNTEYNGNLPGKETARIKSQMVKEPVRIGVHSCWMPIQPSLFIAQMAPSGTYSK